MSDFESEPASDLTLPPCRILVADGSVTLRLLVRGLVRQWGGVAEAVPAATQAEAARDGFDLLITRRTSACSASVKDHWLIVLACNDALGAADAERWVMLPLQPRDLHAVIALSLRPEDETRGIDFGCIQMLWGDAGNPVFRRVAGVFLGEIPRRLHALRGALAQGDTKALLREAHSVGSAAANAGCMAIARTARNLEAAVAAGLEEDYAVLAATLITGSDRDLPLLASIVRMP